MIEKRLDTNKDWGGDTIRNNLFISNSIKKKGRPIYACKGEMVAISYKKLIFADI